MSYVLVVGLLALCAVGCTVDKGRREVANLFQLSPQQAKALKTPDATYVVLAHVGSSIQTAG